MKNHKTNDAWIVLPAGLILLLLVACLLMLLPPAAPWTSWLAENFTGPAITDPVNKEEFRPLNHSGLFVARIAIPLVTAVGTILAACGAGAIFYFHLKQAANQQKQVEIASQQLYLEQFKHAIDHLGNVKQAVVLGGVHSLHLLATTRPEEYRKPVFEILCSFLREETTKKGYFTPVIKGENPRPGCVSRIVVQTIADKLFCEKKPQEKGKEEETHYAGLSANLVNVCFAHIYLVKADLRGANLHGVNFQGAILRKAKFYLAALDKTTFDDEPKRIKGAEINHVFPDSSTYKQHLQEIVEGSGKGIACCNLTGIRLVKAKMPDKQVTPTAISDVPDEQAVQPWWDEVTVKDMDMTELRELASKFAD